LFFSYLEEDLYSFYAQQYMEKNPGVTIEIDYVVREDSTSGISTLNGWVQRVYAEILGRSPADIIDVSFIEPRKVAKSHQFVNLYDYMKEDETFKEEDYYMNILEALEYEGELYTLPTDFSYNIFAFNSEELDVESLKDLEGIAYKDLVNLYEEWKKESGERGLYLHRSFNLEEWITAEVKEFIEVKTKTASLNSQAFISLLERSKELPQNLEYVMLTPEGTGTVSDGSFMYLDDWSYLSENLFRKVRATQNGLTALVEYPNRNFLSPLPETTREGEHVFYTERNFAITAASKQKELAWDFLHYCISEEATEVVLAQIELEQREELEEGRYFLRRYVSLNRNNFERTFTIYLEHLLAFNAQRAPGLNQKQVIKEVLEKLETWNNKQAVYMNVNDELATLIYPEIYAYYTNQITAAQAADRMQVKVELYLNE
jgi:multiple sugar transport system substrate-binding protein